MSRCGGFQQEDDGELLYFHFDNDDDHDGDFFIYSLIMMMNDHDDDDNDDDDDDQVVDLPDEKLQALHKEAKVLYDSYIKVTDHNHCHVIVIIVI